MIEPAEKPDAAPTSLPARIARGDRRAFDRLYAETSGTAWFVVCRVLGEDGPAAEEAMQEAYLSVWRRAGSYHDGFGSPRRWVVTVARNAAIDRRRQDARPAPEPPAAPPEPSTPEEALDTADQRRILLWCLGELEHDRAAAIVRAYYTGETYAEMAAATGRAEGTLKSWVRRSLTTLRRCLDEKGART